MGGPAKKGKLSPLHHSRLPCLGRSRMSSPYTRPPPLASHRCSSGWKGVPGSVDGWPDGWMDGWMAVQVIQISSCPPLLAGTPFLSPLERPWNLDNSQAPHRGNVSARVQFLRTGGFRYPLSASRRAAGSLFLHFLCPIRSSFPHL